MLRALIFLIFLIFSPLIAAENCEQNSLRENSLRENPLKGETKSCAISFLEDDLSKEAHSFRDMSLQKADEVLRGKGFSLRLFQDFIAEAGVKNQGTRFPVENVSLPHTLPDSRFLTPASCYVFISFALSEKALLNLVGDAKRWGATLVLRGFKEGSYTKTAKALQKIILKTGQGVIIDPELFTLFAVTAVPTIVLSKPVSLLSTERVQTPLHDRLQGHVSVQYALEAFAKEGDLSLEAQALLQKGSTR